ncbi:UNVERIFIED_CONTAM: hypothetical protein Scaly_0478900 [Sesamum calycinum]|uniref:Tf2-1-like SH3-like domain-containing protein n=1 Tax=Sesamum calycinum TaxID=2727403 RepID=A0AAW2SHQ3_9LAMI
MEYEVGGRVFLKISPLRGILRFGKHGKLSPRYIGPYEILEQVGPLAYRLALPAELSQIHDVFHVSMLRRYQSDPSHILREPVKWSHHSPIEATWEVEENMREKYPYLFPEPIWLMWSEVAANTWVDEALSPEDVLGLDSGDILGLLSSSWASWVYLAVEACLVRQWAGTSLAS